MKAREIIRNGLWDQNVVLAQILGMCPTMALTSSASNGLGMGLATTAVLVVSNMAVSSVRKVVTEQVRIPVFIAIIATIVTLVDMSLNAWMHELYKVLGLYIALIVANCAILGRAEAFACKNGVVDSALDGLFMGLGFTAVLTTIGIVREVVGSGTVFSQASLLLGPHFAFLETTVIPGYGGTLMMILPPGGFLTLGLLLAVKKRIEIRQRNAGVAVVSVPSHCGA
ncbi:electron transport complex subunit E [Uliginosibacterium gangwonense]|uniref:electron transport complex subunit E n=1 Tax=Uliginosibacterium gangwonense TaxID=392736 RepID=UPI000368F654|nr:electron transport complex subunit E [Uliginosibacterium gangwonense]